MIKFCSKIKQFKNNTPKNRRAFHRMKIFKKIYYHLLFRWFLQRKIRSQNKDIDNNAGLITINPLNESKLSHLPKIIWMYWEGNQSALLKACIQRIRDLHPDYTIHFLSPENISLYSQLDFSDEVIQKVTAQQRADLIRFDLIYQHGGIWLDASTLVYEKLHWIDELIQRTHTQSFAYYRAKNTSNLNYPVIENWLLASTQNNIFYRYWGDELYQALKIGPKNYVAEIKKQSNSTDIFQRIGRLEYLIAYVVCQKVMREYPVSMTFIDCDQNAFLYQVSNQWVKEKIAIDMAVNLAPQGIPRLIKLAGKERKALEAIYAKSQYLPKSLIDI
jgi:hypothetical protein